MHLTDSDDKDTMVTDMHGGISPFHILSTVVNLFMYKHCYRINHPWQLILTVKHKITKQIFIELFEKTAAHHMNNCYSTLIKTYLCQSLDWETTRNLFISKSRKFTIRWEVFLATKNENSYISSTICSVLEWHTLKPIYWHRLTWLPA